MAVYIPLVREPEFKLKGLPQNIAMTEKQVRGILMKAGRNGDGSLSKDELKKAFKEFSSRIGLCKITGLSSKSITILVTILK